MAQRKGIYQRERSPYWYYDVVDAAGVRRRRSTGTEDKVKAQEVADRMRAQTWDIRAGRTPDYTFKEAVARWMDERGHKKSIADDEQMLGWWAAKVGGVLLTKLTRDLLMAHLNERKAATSPQRANRYLSVIRAVLRLSAREWGWLKAAPILSQFPEPKGRVRWLKESEVVLLLASLPEHQRIVMMFALATGMRQANILKLRWDMVDMEQRIAWVKADHMKNGRAFGVALNDDAMWVLRSQMGKSKTHVFTYRGNSIAQINTETWRNALKVCGIEDFRWHDLRHTWASRLRQQGVPLDVLQQLGGWEKPDMVMRYGHLSSEHLLAHQQKGAGLAPA